MSRSSRLEELNVTLPKIPNPVGSYLPATRVGDLIVTSGQLPIVNGELIAAGKVPDDVSVADARQSAKVAALNALAAVVSVAGDIERIGRIIRVAVFVNSAARFTDQAKVADGASDFLVELFGEEGRHVRAAVGASELPLGAAVELELTVCLRS